MAEIISCKYPAYCKMKYGFAVLPLKKLSIMGIWQQIAEYLYLKKKTEETPAGSWMKYMHGMNRISLIIFLLGLGVIIFKLVIRPLLQR
jgi:Ni,Fe-hydrogenase I cytochrome b subunit